MAEETRCFEFHEGTSNKFWTITLKGTRNTVRFGRKGTAGQEQHKEFDNNPAARAAFDKQIAEKIKKGYHEVDAATANSPPTEERGAPLSPLRRALLAIDLHFKKTDPDTYRALHKGASAKDLALLSHEVFGGAPVPPDLIEWFSWHNGQKEDEDVVELFPARTFSLMTVVQAVELCKDYRQCEEEWAQRWDKSWVPFMQNGAGDYMCYVPSSGKTIKYWHDGPDDEGGVDDYDSLLHLARSAMEVRTRKPTPLRFEWDNLSMSSPIKEIDYETVLNAPLRTTYFGGPGGPEGKYLVAVLGPQGWVMKWVAGSLIAAFQAVGDEGNTRNPMTAYAAPAVFAELQRLLENAQVFTVQAIIWGT